MNTASLLATIALAGFIHASFQLSVSVLTLLGTHSAGAKVTRVRMFKLVNGFIFGAIITTALLLSSITLWLQLKFGTDVPPIVWSSMCGLLFGLGAAVWIFYYRRGPGTSLWLPRGLARFLVTRSKATRVTAEAVSLGSTSVLAEILFIVGPMVATGLILIELEPFWQLAGLVTYTLVSMLPLAVVTLSIGSGHSPAGIQRWREANKGFLQFIAGFGLVVLGFCIYVNQVSGGLALTPAGL